MFTERRIASKRVDALPRHLRNHKRTVESPENSGRKARCERVLPAIAATDHHVELARCEALEEVEHQLRRLLQVGRHDTEVLAGGCAESRTDRGHRSEIAGMQQQAGHESGIRQALLELAEAVVGAAVNDEDHLERLAVARFDFHGELVQRCDQRRYRSLVPVHGNDDG